MFEEVYSISVFPDAGGIRWMNLRSEHVLFCASPSTVRLFDLNYICSFWATVRCAVKTIRVVPKYSHKTSHILVYGEDKCIRIYGKKSGHKKCTVLPPPESFGHRDNLSFSYDRVGNVLYILFNEEQLWIYVTRTDPATRVTVWNVQDIVKSSEDGDSSGGDGAAVSYVLGCSNSEMSASKDFGAGSYKEQKEEERY